VVIGVLGGAVPYFACTRIKSLFGYDDALDVFGVHGIGGTVGLVLTGVFASTAVNPNLNTNLAALVGRSLWIEQVKGIGLTLVWAMAGTALIAGAVKALMKLRPSIEEEHDGLDLSDHGEEGYIYEPKA
jgi:Amt family ammonium transporter